MKDHVTDLETSKKFQEAGIRGEGKWYHCLLVVNHKQCWRLCIKPDVLANIYFCEEDGGLYYGTEFSEIIPAYLLYPELLDMVEGAIEPFRNDLGEWAIDVPDDTIDGGLYNTGYHKSFILATAEAILWQKEQGQ